MRISSAVCATLLLAACGDGASDPGYPTNVQTGERVAEADMIACAHGDAPLQRDCTVDRETGDGGELVLTVRHPDGAFRRLMVMQDGRGVIAADGAQPAVVTLADGDLDVRLAGDHYRLPATVKDASAS